MKRQCLLLSSLFLAAQAFGQSEFYFTFRGTSYETNASGQVQSQRITEKTILQDVLARKGITDPSGYALVYHVKGHSLGDTMDIVNPATGAAYDTLYGLFFGQDFGRVGITNAPGTSIKRVDYVYEPAVNGNSIGAALVTIGSSTNSKGVVRSSYQGQMQWLIMPRGTNGTKVCVGQFRTTKPLVFGN